MNEVEFIARRIINEAEEWSLRAYEETKGRAGVEQFYNNRFTARMSLINYLKETFLQEGKGNEPRND